MIDIASDMDRGRAPYDDENDIMQNCGHTSANTKFTSVELYHGTVSQAQIDRGQVFFRAEL